jgi:hypothetical protein
MSGEITTVEKSTLYKLILDYFCTLFVPTNYNTLIYTHDYFLYRQINFFTSPHNSSDYVIFYTQWQLIM